MYVRRNIPTSLILAFAWPNLLMFTLWSSTITGLYIFFEPRGIHISLPFLPLSTIGIAVAFYLGFKNSQSYDRLWEARKIWGGIINASRTWANQVLSYVEDETLQQRLIYRQLAWVNSLRLQLRRTTIHDRRNLSYVPDLKLKLERDNNNEQQIAPFLAAEEYQALMTQANPATQMLRRQGADLRELRKNNQLESLEQQDLMRTLETLYGLQGGCERIKNTPFPRQYAYFSAVFAWIFALLLPFGLVGEFAKMHAGTSIWLTVPCTVLISWIFHTIEVVGDNSEDPFENHITDVPMTALCRTIEIDLRQMLGETDIPPKIEPINGILL